MFSRPIAEVKPDRLELEKRWRRIVRGMMAADVLAILGSSQDLGGEGNDEAWSMVWDYGPTLGRFVPRSQHWCGPGEYAMQIWSLRVVVNRSPLQLAKVFATSI